MLLNVSGDSAGAVRLSLGDMAARVKKSCGRCVPQAMPKLAKHSLCETVLLAPVWRNVSTPAASSSTLGPGAAVVVLAGAVSACQPGMLCLAG